MAKKPKKTIDEVREFISDESCIPEAIKELEDEEIQLVKISPKLPFDAWFDKMLKNGRVKYWQHATILTFFKKNGLALVESEDTYQECFKKF